MELMRKRRKTGVAVITVAVYDDPLALPLFLRGGEYACGRGL
jgi:hypothetical protein